MTIALIAGTGGLPPAIARVLVENGRKPIICEMRGFKSDIDTDFVRIGFRIETLGTFLADLKTQGVTEVCMAGAMQRPDVDPSAIDGATAPMVPRLMAALAKGDDGTLREIIILFEEHGFVVRGAHEIAPDLLPRVGVATQQNAPELAATLVAAKAALAEMGQADQGQAVLIKGDRVIAREDSRGTAALLKDHSTPLSDPSELSGGLGDVFGVFGDAIDGVADWVAGRDLHEPPAGQGAVLYKGPKPNQVMQADMPLIGPDTAMQAAEAGLDGIVIPHGGVMVLDLAQTVAILDAHDMFLWVHP